VRQVRLPVVLFSWIYSKKILLIQGDVKGAL